MQADLYRYLGADAVGFAPHPGEIACFFTPDGALERDDIMLHHSLSF